MKGSSRMVFFSHAVIPTPPKPRKKYGCEFGEKIDARAKSIGFLYSLRKWIAIDEFVIALWQFVFSLVFEFEGIGWFNFKRTEGKTIRLENRWASCVTQSHSA